MNRPFTGQHEIPRAYRLSPSVGELPLLPAQLGCRAPRPDIGPGAKNRDAAQSAGHTKDPALVSQTSAELQDRADGIVVRAL
jgi:hypothetical protein